MGNIRFISWHLASKSPESDAKNQIDDFILLQTGYTNKYNPIFLKNKPCRQDFSFPITILVMVTRKCPPLLQAQNHRERDLSTEHLTLSPSSPAQTNEINFGGYP